MVERQIKQLHDAGIKQIIIVVGYLKEKYYEMAKKYKDLIGKMTMERFNDNQKRERIMKKIYSYNKNVEVADPMVRGGVS